MNEELLQQLEDWHEEDEFEEIVEAIMAIPAKERDYELVSHLGRAMNNLERYEEAIEQFLRIKKKGQDDPLWHYRIGLAYYYLDRYEEARVAFEAADRLEPDDEDTLEFLEWIQEKTTEGARVEETPSVEPPVAASADATGFWNDMDPAAASYVSAPPTDELIESVQEELVFKLPESYIQLMKSHNGGIPHHRLFTVPETEQQIQISGILGIGRDQKKSLCGRLGSRHLIESGGYPEVGVVICDCPSESEVVMLDYRSSGNDGEPEVIHVDRTNDNKITRLASNFDTFIHGLANA
ncbi:hypothetical protein JCM10914A_18470 [Paenibacillus sp. JCM 10914]|uniref:SMI1/KNR4 family protein n=1 Tax=Paenibacillus sp. JCM 10914 TaxID=1236974 RepID=UPI0003CC83F0|nr:SMI1/KNR4 family protein [Paenibacillus sp. JCM 10914]GAE06279.1 hypothetical protein JCM10914_2428 [Paenibacillus sp. JCM 10914]